MVELRARLRELEGEQRDVVTLIAGNGSGFAVAESRTAEFTATLRELEGCVNALDDLGVQVKDLDIGLLDFPALRPNEEGQVEEVLLCWKVGEDAVDWWHREEDGFAGRKPIDWGEEGSE
jgi:hypothetical protein